MKEPPAKAEGSFNPVSTAGAVVNLGCDVSITPYQNHTTLSIQAVSWVLEHSVSTGHARLVLVSIANHADAEGAQSWPGVERVAKEAGCSRATVFRSLTVLKELGELDWEPGGGRARSNYYWMPAFRNSLNLRRIPVKTVSSVAVNRLKHEINRLTGETRTVLKNRPIEPRAISHRMRDVTEERLQQEQQEA